MQDIESSMHEENRDVKETLENAPLSIAQVEQRQAALDQLHEDVSEVNTKFSNSTEEDIARDQIQRIKDNLKYLEDNLINQAAEEAAKL